MKAQLARWAPIAVALLSLLWLFGKAVPPRDAAGTFAVQDFGRLPVVYEGRIKPLDTLARNSLTIISDRQTWRDATGRQRPAIEWLLDVMSGLPRADDHRVFRIHNFQLLEQLGLERRRGYRFAFAEFEPRLVEIEQQAAAASRLERGERDVYDNKLLEFWRRVTLYHVLVESHRVPPADDFNAAIRQLEALDRFSLPHLVPPAGVEEDWQPMLRSVVEGAMTGQFNPAVRPLAAVLAAWARGDVQSFNTSLASYRSMIATNTRVDPAALRFEAFFNHLAPFYQCSVLYVLAFVLGCFAWLGGSETLRRTTTWMLGATFAIHTLAIASRVYISGYPPITNLYGTAVFIGWGCVLIGLFLERVHALGVGNILSAMVGFLTLLIAHFLAGDGDTLQMMQAVLDTKFWLATHVIIINFGYSATFLAGGLSVLYILRGVFTRSLGKETERAFGRMIYGVISFALLLSFVGTVLGGLWADDSWGRFWGWDPKENGALMIVLWNALILHARWGGLVKIRGVAVLSIFGGIVTAWSWFGVNQLGVGLHSYGFTDSVTFWLVIFVASQLAIMALGLVPRRLWRSPGSARRTAAADLPAAFGGDRQ